MVQTTEKEWFSIAETCAYLGMSRDTIIGLIHNEGLPAVRFQRLYRVSRKALDAWMLKRGCRQTTERQADRNRREAVDE
ncbi:MAG: helix-turn-helix domain-containing protein [Chloroflexi bacterium]|nr:helix-turn-helix domain-containing protein [Chloroflexota bacterium]